MTAKPSLPRAYRPRSKVRTKPDNACWRRLWLWWKRLRLRAQPRD